MTAKIIPFPDPGAPMSDEEERGILLGIHARLSSALLHDQDEDMHMTLDLDLDEVIELMALIESVIDPDDEIDAG